eukprot:COSAG06_NODE_66673_length_253_cov_7.038961_1_plen_51_part_01
MACRHDLTHLLTAALRNHMLALAQSRLQHAHPGGGGNFDHDMKGARLYPHV